MFRPLVALRWIVALSVVLFAAGAHAQIFESYHQTPVPVPRGSATKEKPLVLSYSVYEKGRAVKKFVTITDLPARKRGETNAQAIQRKADTIVDAINKQIGPGKAEIIPEEQAVPKKFPGPVVKGRPWIKITGLAGGTDARGNPIETAGVAKDPTLQAGNGGRTLRGSGGKLSMGGVIGNSDLVDYVATGFDPEGELSLVEFGIDGLYVASLTPEPGMLDLSILALLSADLAANGIANTFDAAARTLTITPLHDPEDYSIYWTSTDPGLPFSGAVFAVPVSEPGAWVMLLAGLGMIVQLRRPGSQPRARAQNGKRGQTQCR